MKEITVNAWAIVSKKGTSRGTLFIRDNYHVYAIHPTKERAVANTPKSWRGGNLYSVRKCEVSYEVPQGDNGTGSV